MHADNSGRVIWTLSAINVHNEAIRMDSYSLKLYSPNLNLKFALFAYPHKRGAHISMQTVPKCTLYPNTCTDNGKSSIQYEHTQLSLQLFGVNSHYIWQRYAGQYYSRAKFRLFQPQTVPRKRITFQFEFYVSAFNNYNLLMQCFVCNVILLTLHFSTITDQFTNNYNKMKTLKAHWHHN